MSAIPSSVSRSPAHVWFSQNLPEIQSRARACLSHLLPEQRAEASAEILGSIFKTCVSAQNRGTLHNITPFHAVVYAVKHYRAGRRMAGYSSTDVMSEATQLKGRSKVVSLDSITEHDLETGRPLPLSEVLADRRQDNNPSEHVRQNLDYPVILRTERVSRKARKVFRLLSEVRGQGAGLFIAHELKVSEGRVTQLKDQLGDALARHDYGPPPTREATLERRSSPALRTKSIRRSVGVGARAALAG